MKKIFAVALFATIIFAFFSYHPASRTSAAAPPCNGGSGSCTYCNTNAAGNCFVDTSRSNCATSGYAPDSSYCVDRGGGCPSGPSDCSTVTQSPPPSITGYFCETSQAQCLPCHSGDTNTRCNPPSYSTSSSCNTACRGQTPKKFACVNKQCVESGNGNYSDIATCTAACEVGTGGTGGPDITKCDNGKDGIQTAIGCIQVFNQTSFLSNILTWAVGIGGGIAFLLIIYAGFMIMTGAGNPERLKAGQELLTSALSGLILLVLSIFILKFIGIDILQLGQFGFGAKPTPKVF